MKLRKPGLGVDFVTNAEREKIERVESLVAHVPAAQRSPSLGSLVAQVAQPGSDNFDLQEFRFLAEQVREMSKKSDALAASGAAKELLELALPISSSEAAIRDKLVKILEPLSTPERESVYRELDLMQQIVDIRERVSEAHTDAQNARAQFDLILPEFQEKWHEIVRRSKLAPVPPSSSTAANLEALMQAYAYVTEPVMHFSRLPDESHQEAARAAAMMMVVHLATREPSVSKFLDKVTRLDLSDDGIVATQHFAVRWMRSGFTRLEIGHKLAASLALTDVPDDIEVRAPWDCWCLILPPNLMGDDNSVARIWCEGPEVRFFVSSTGTIMGPISRDMIFRESDEPGGRAFAIACDALVRGCCLALANPDDYRKRGAGTGRSSKSKRARGEAPDFGGARFMLSAPVTIDLREHLVASLSGKHEGGSPTAQFLVRGHWRNQAYGAGRALRKTIWIEPFWKGDETARVLLRNYKTRDE